MINLTCPHCHAELGVDDGFGGGVCRCFSCGTLMTVPSEAEGQAAETLERPEDPSQATAEAAAAEATYRTASGRTVRLTAQDLDRVPLAQRRRVGIRLTIIALFVVVFGALTVAVLFSAYLVISRMQPEGDVDPTKAAVDAFGYDPHANPYLSDQRRIMNMPVAKRTVIMIDASTAMTHALSYAKQAVITALPHLTRRHQLQVVFSREEAPVAHPNEMTAASDISADDLTEQMDNVFPRGAPALAPALSAALAAEPDKIILMISQIPGDELAAQIEPAIKESDVELDIVMIDYDDTQVAELAEATGGRCMSYPLGQLQRWYEEYFDAQYDAEETEDAEEPMTDLETETEAETEP